MNLLDDTLNHASTLPKPGKWTFIVQVHELRGLKQTKSGGSAPKPVIYINVWDKQ